MQKKKPVEYRKNKAAFDAVMSKLREFGRPTLGGLGAVNLERTGGSPSSQNPARPTPVDFRADIFRVVALRIPKDINLVAFHIAYTLWDSEDQLEQELHAQKTLGNRRHSVEQRLGAEFIRRGIFPVMGKGYFYSIRKERPRGNL
jgi:hypothetical protein